MIQEHIGISGTNFPSHHDQTKSRPGQISLGAFDVSQHRRSSNPEIFSNDEDSKYASGRSISQIQADYSKTQNYKISKNDSSLKNMKKEAHLATTKIDQVELPIDRRGAIEHKGALTQRVKKDFKSDTEKHGKAAINKKISDTNFKFNPTPNRKQSASRVNLQCKWCDRHDIVNTGELDNTSNPTAGFPQIPTATK